MIKLYEVPRDSKIDVSHLDIALTTGETITELIFMGMDGAYGKCYLGEVKHENELLMYGNTEVKLIKEEL